MTTSELIRQILEEFAARGWNAVLHGPEVHLALPVAGALALATAVTLIKRRREK